MSFQLKPPHVMSEAVTYSKLLSEMTSMIGQTTDFLSMAISWSRGSSQPSVHSQWASRNVSTLPYKRKQVYKTFKINWTLNNNKCTFAFLAPRSRARIRPERFPVLNTFTEVLSPAAYSSSFLPKKSLSEASSTKIISLIKERGDRLMTG